MKAYLRLPVGLCPDRGRSAISRQLSVLDSWPEAVPNLIPKIYHLIPLLILVFVSCGAVLAQEPVGHTAPAAKAENKAIDLTAQGVQIGEKVPDVTINNIHNYKTSTAKLSDFKGKLLILDFWATWCSPCVAMIPKMDSLQKEFGDKIQFLSVTYQKEEEILPFMKKLEERDGRRYDLPVVVEDNSLRNTFPHRTLPHYVWIDGNGKVLAVTSFEEVNEKKIREILTGSTQIDQKIDLMLNYDLSKLLINQKAPLYLSALTPFIPGVDRREEFVSGTKSQGPRLVMLNSSLRVLFAKAYGGDKRFQANRIILDLKDSTGVGTHLTGSSYLKWAEDNTYCYEVMLPLTSTESIYKFMQNDLNKFFSEYQVSIDTINTRCLALVRINNLDNMKTKGGEVNMVISSDKGLIANNISLRKVVHNLNVYFLQNSPLPIIDATDYKNNVDISFGSTLRSIKAMNNELAKYGLKFIETMKDLEMLVITDKK